MESSLLCQAGSSKYCRINSFSSVVANHPVYIPGISHSQYGTCFMEYGLVVAPVDQLGANAVNHPMFHHPPSNYSSFA